MSLDAEITIELEVGGRYADEKVKNQKININGYKLRLGDIDKVTKRLGHISSPYFLNNFIEDLGYNLDEARKNFLDINDVFKIRDTCYDILNYIDNLSNNLHLSAEEIINKLEDKYLGFIKSEYDMVDKNTSLQIFVSELRDMLSILGQGLDIMHANAGGSFDITYTIFY